MLAKRFVSAENRWRGLGLKKKIKKVAVPKKTQRRDPLVSPLLLHTMKKIGPNSESKSILQSLHRYKSFFVAMYD